MFLHIFIRLFLSETNLCNLVIIEHFEIFKMATKMAATIKKWNSLLNCCLPHSSVSRWFRRAYRWPTAWSGRWTSSCSCLTPSARGSWRSARPALTPSSRWPSSWRTTGWVWLWTRDVLRGYIDRVFMKTEVSISLELAYHSIRFC